MWRLVLLILLTALGVLAYNAYRNLAHPKEIGLVSKNYPCNSFRANSDTFSG